MRVFVAGGTGVIGRRLVPQLVARGDQVTATTTSASKQGLLQQAEVLTHGWDLARANGQLADFPDDVAERALARSRRRLVTRPEGPGAPFAAEVLVPQEAPAVDRLAGFLGRAV